VTTGQIYWGAVPFVLIQLLMVGLVIAFPNLVLGSIEKAEAVDASKVQIDIQQEDYGGSPAESQ
ncbi:TRAP-type mannitol/chloroaromatic compound transport system, large permease component, partial [Magnetospirillum fulvum MGU-K5]